MKIKQHLIAELRPLKFKVVFQYAWYFNMLLAFILKKVMVIALIKLSMEPVFW